MLQATRAQFSPLVIVMVMAQERSMHFLEGTRQRLLCFGYEYLVANAASVHPGFHIDDNVIHHRGFRIHVRSRACVCAARARACVNVLSRASLSVCAFAQRTRRTATRMPFNTLPLPYAQCTVLAWGQANILNEGPGASGLWISVIRASIFWGFTPVMEGRSSPTL